MHCPSLVVKCFFAFHRFLQKCHDFVISFVRIDESAEAYVRFSPEFPVYVGKPVLYWTVFSMGTHFCMKSYVKLHKRCFADTVPPNASGAADSSAPPVLSVRDAFHRGAITGKSRAGYLPHGFFDLFGFALGDGAHGFLGCLFVKAEDAVLHAVAVNFHHVAPVVGGAGTGGGKLQLR